MMKRFVILLALLLVNPIKAMEVQNSDDNQIETQFKELQKRKGDLSDSEYFDAFVNAQISRLLEGPYGIEGLFSQMRAGTPIPCVSEEEQKHKLSIPFLRKIKKGKKEYNALFDFVKKHKEQYGIAKELDTEVQGLEDFVSSMQSQIAIEENGRLIVVDESIEPEDHDSADYCSTAITAYEMRANLRRKFEKLPSEKAIKKLPQTMAAFKKLQKHYKYFIDKYPHDDRQTDYKTKLEMSKKLLETFPKEYFVAKPSKRKIEEDSIVSFLRAIKYMETQALFDYLEKLTSEEAHDDMLDKIGLTANKMRVYEKRYPSLEQENAALLHKAANLIESGIAQHINMMAKKF